VITCNRNKRSGGTICFNYVNFFIEINSNIRGNVYAEGTIVTANTFYLPATTTAAPLTFFGSGIIINVFPIQIRSQYAADVGI